MESGAAAQTGMLAVLGLAGGAVAWVWKHYSEKHRTTVEEYRQLVSELRDDVKSLRKDYADLWGQFQDAEIRCDRDLAQIRVEREQDRQRYEAELRRQANRIGKLQVDNQALRSELSASRSVEAAARAGLNPFFAQPSSWAFTILVCDERGKILEANAGAAILFHWSPEELLNQNVECLIPERYHEAHRVGMAGLASRGELSQPGRTLALAGLTRDGDEVPVELYLETWLARGERRCGAVIRRRWLAHEPTKDVLSDPEFPAYAPADPVPVRVVNPPAQPVPVAPAPPPSPEGKS